MTEFARTLQPTRPTTRSSGWAEALAAWVVARLAVAAGFAIADSLDATQGLRDRIHLEQGLFTWDGAFYWGIAHDGYSSVAREGLRFFPLYPMLSRALAWPIGDRVGLTLVLVTNVAALVCMVLLRRLVEEETGDPDLARRAMWLLALFPSAAVLVLAYGESLMLAATLGAFLMIRRERWWWAAVLALVAGLTRPVGAFLVVPFAIEAWARTPRRDWPGRIAAAAAGPAGALMFLFWVGGEYGDWLEPLDIQRQLRAGFQDPATRLWDGVHTMVTTSQLDAPNVLFALGFVALLVVCVRTQRASWSAYAAVTVLVALSAHNIDSIGRYGLVAFPLVVALARLGEDERAMWGLVALSTGGLVALTTMSVLGSYTP
jgi:hypothetical protein